MVINRAVLTPLQAGPVTPPETLPGVASMKTPQIKTILEKIASFAKSFYNKELKRQKTKKTTKSRFNQSGGRFGCYDDYPLYLVPIHSP